MLVCTGNLCRSPMASAILKHRLAELGLQGSVRVESAGTRTAAGYPASAHAQEAVAAAGLSLAELVLVMEESHRRSLFHLSPGDLAKVYLLSEMVGGNDDISDPMGGEYQDYLETFRLLESIIEAGLPAILRRLGISAKTSVA
jgi:protein-tyrosine phosphatase